MDARGTSWDHVEARGTSWKYVETRRNSWKVPGGVGHIYGKSGPSFRVGWPVLAGKVARALRQSRLKD